MLFSSFSVHIVLSLKRYPNPSDCTDKQPSLSLQESLKSVYDKLPTEDASADADNEQTDTRSGGRRSGKSKEKPAFKETAIQNEVLGVDVTMHEQMEEEEETADDVTMHEQPAEIAETAVAEKVVQANPEPEE